MNKDRRKALTALAERIAHLTAQLDEAKGELETIRDEEQEYFDNMPESFQSGDKGETATNAVDMMETALSALGEFIDADVSGTVEEAAA